MFWLLYTGHVCRHNIGPPKGALRDRAAGTLPSSPFAFSLSQEVGYMSLAVSRSWCTKFSAMWPYLALLRCLYVRGVGKQPKFSGFFYSESAYCQTIPTQPWKEEMVLIYEQCSRLWSLSREYNKVYFCRLLFVEFKGPVCHSYQLSFLK